MERHYVPTIRRARPLKLKLRHLPLNALERAQHDRRRLFNSWVRLQRRREIERFNDLPEKYRMPWTQNSVFAWLSK